VSVPMILSDLEKWDTRSSPVFPADLRIVRSCRLTQNDQIRHENTWWRGVFLWDQPRHQSTGAGPQRSIMLRPLPMPIWFDLRGPNSAR